MVTDNLYCVATYLWMECDFLAWMRKVWNAVTSRASDEIDLPFYPGQIVPVSGVYDVDHVRQSGYEQVMLSAGQRFPTCERCGYAITFYLAYPTNRPDDSGIVLYQIPHYRELGRHHGGHHSSESHPKKAA